MMKYENIINIRKRKLSNKYCEYEPTIKIRITRQLYPVSKNIKNLENEERKIIKEILCNLNEELQILKYSMEKIQKQQLLDYHQYTEQHKIFEKQLLYNFPANNERFIIRNDLFKLVENYQVRLGKQMLEKLQIKQKIIQVNKQIEYYENKV